MQPDKKSVIVYFSTLVAENFVLSRSTAETAVVFKGLYLSFLSLHILRYLNDLILSKHKPPTQNSKNVRTDQKID